MYLDGTNDNINVSTVDESSEDCLSHLFRMLADGDIIPSGHEEKEWEPAESTFEQDVLKLLRSGDPITAGPNRTLSPVADNGKSSDSDDNPHGIQFDRISKMCYIDRRALAEAGAVFVDLTPLNSMWYKRIIGVPHADGFALLDADGGLLRVPDMPGSEYAGSAEIGDLAGLSGEEVLRKLVQSRIDRKSGEYGTLSDHQLVLRKVKLQVLGTVEGTSLVRVYSNDTGRTFEVDTTRRIKFENLLLHAGPIIEEEVDSVADGGDALLITINQISTAIAHEGSQRVINDDSTCGAGITEITDGKLAIVSKSGASTFDGGDLKPAEAIVVDGKVLDTNGSPDWFTAGAIVSVGVSKNRDYRIGAIDQANEIFGRWDNWTHPGTPHLVTALVMATWIQDVWELRPQVFVVGGSNTGKTFLLQEYIAKMFGQLAVTTGANTSEAGIRQALKSGSRPLLIDEFENSKERKKILELIRSASRGSEIVKGTADHTGVKWAAAIEHGLVNEADQNRFIQLNLDSIPKGRPSRLQKEDPDVLQSLGFDLMAIAMRYAFTAKRLAVKLRTESFGKVDRRCVETYAVPAAMLGTAMGLDWEKTVALLGEWLETRGDMVSSDIESDEESLLEQILGAMAPRADHTVGQLIREIRKGTVVFGRDETDPADILERCGLKLFKSGKGGDQRSDGVEADSLFIACKQARRMLLPNEKGKSIKTILMRIDGAKDDRKVVGSSNSRGVSIPLTALAGDDSECDSGVFDDQRPF